jgi:hypothetical protein
MARRDIHTSWPVPRNVRAGDSFDFKNPGWTAAIKFW